jgi:hypothetical protein
MLQYAHQVFLEIDVAQIHSLGLMGRKHCFGIMFQRFGRILLHHPAMEGWHSYPSWLY